MSDFARAKAMSDQLNKAVGDASLVLKAIPGIGSGAMGLTPDSVRITPEYKSAKCNYELAFNQLRTFNAVYTKQFKAELAAERNAKRNAKRLALME